MGVSKGVYKSFHVRFADIGVRDNDLSYFLSSDPSINLIREGRVSRESARTSVLEALDEDLATHERVLNSLLLLLLLLRLRLGLRGGLGGWRSCDGGLHAGRSLDLAAGVDEALLGEDLVERLLLQVLENVIVRLLQHRFDLIQPLLQCLQIIKQHAHKVGL